MWLHCVICTVPGWRQDQCQLIHSCYAMQAKSPAMLLGKPTSTLHALLVRRSHGWLPSLHCWAGCRSPKIPLQSMRQLLWATRSTPVNLIPPCLCPSCSSRLTA